MGAEPFTVPNEIRLIFETIKRQGQNQEAEWNQKFEAYKQAYPELALQFEQAMNGELPEGWDPIFPCFRPMHLRWPPGSLLVLP